MSHTIPMSNNVALTTLEQLGGKRFVAMTGANGFLFGSDRNTVPTVQFYFKGCRKFNHLTVGYWRELDEYTMTFLKITSKGITATSEHGGVYCDQLQAIFTRVTGLDTHL